MLQSYIVSRMSKVDHRNNVLPLNLLLDLRMSRIENVNENPMTRLEFWLCLYVIVAQTPRTTLKCMFL